MRAFHPGHSAGILFGTMGHMSKRNQPRPQRSRARNAIERPRSGQGTQYDFNTEQAPAFPWLSPLLQDKFATQLYMTDWAAKKIVQIPVDDALRNGWETQGLSDEQQDLVATTLQELDALNVYRQARRLERLVGGAAIYIGAADGETDPSKPLRLEAIQQGGLKFLNAMPRSRFTRVEWETNPLSPHYGRPQFYWVNGQQVHRSRFILFHGDPLLPVPDYTIQANGIERADGFGQSVLMGVFEDLARATGTRQAAYQLIQRASIFIAAMDLDGLSGSDMGQSQIEAIRNVINQINIYRGAVVDKVPGDTTNPISVLGAQFGSVPELLMSNLQVLSAASDIPATRFLGQAPGGLNATGEGDLENYYGRIEADRTRDDVPKLMHLMRIVCRSLFGIVPPDMRVAFDPLWSLSESEEADVRTKDIANVIAMHDAGLITDDEAVEELNNRDVTTVTLSGDDVAEVSALPEPSTLTPEQAAAQLTGTDDGTDPPAA